MLKAAIEKILSLDAPHIEEIEGRTYVDKDMTQIGKELRATSITMSNLSSLVDFIKKSKADFKTGHYIAQVVSPTEVRLFSSLDADRQRETLAVVKAEIPEFSFGQFIGNEEFVIGVQSKFLNEDAEANDKPIILQFAGNVKAGTVAEYGDTGVGQKAAIKKGVASLQEVEVPSPCRLMHWRKDMAKNNKLINREPVLGCTYSVHDDGTITLTAYSKNFCYTIEHELNTTDYHLKENIAPNPLRRIPVVEFYLNDRMGIFEKVIPLMDAMNLVDSDRINDILQHVQSLLWMHNCQVNEEGKKNLVDGDGVIMTKSTGDGKEAKITYLNQTLNESEVQKLVDHLNSQLEQITSTPSWQEASGGSTTGAMQLSNGWQCLEISAKTVEQLFTEPEMQLIDLAIEIIKTDQRPYDGLKDIETADVEIRFCRTKTYDLVSKTNSLVALLNAGVDGLTSFNTVGLFTDPQQAWVDSKPIIDGIQKKLASKEEKTQQPNPNAYKDEEGNGGENNTEKDKTEESKQPSKTAMVEE